MQFVLKRYEICLNVQQTLNPAFFDENNWAKKRFISEIAPIMPQMLALISASALVENVTFQGFSFATEQERLDFAQGRQGWVREFNFLCRHSQLTNSSVNLFFDYEETIDDAAVITPNIDDIKSSKFNPMLGPYSLRQHADLLTNALMLQFPG